MEFFGWASVRSNTYEISDEEDSVLLANLREQIENVKYLTVAIHLDIGLNGSVNALSVAGFTNHRYPAVINLFEWLAENSPGSYGLLYVWDDEDYKRGGDYENVFRVWRLARGTLQELDDPFLSPCVPTIEDPFDPDRE